MHAGFTTPIAIALSNITILGGAISNFVFNAPRSHPRLDRPLIDWSLALVMEPATILGSILGGYINKVRTLQLSWTIFSVRGSTDAIFRSSNPSNHNKK